MIRRSIRYAVGIIVAIIFLSVKRLPNTEQSTLAESVADNLMQQSQEGETGLREIGQGFGKGDLQQVEAGGPILSFRRVNSFRKPALLLGNFVVDYEVQRASGTRRERVLLDAGYTRSYSRDYASVMEYEVFP